MTALERLRKLAHEMPEDNVWVGMLRGNLLDICHDIEREQDALVKDSPDEREAIAWVREHGGLEPIKSSLSALELLAEGIEIDTGLAFYDESPKERCVALRNEVKSRLMPEGMEWPCFDDGEPVRIGDEYADAFGANTVATIEFGDGYSAINPNTPGGYVVGKFEGAHGRYVPRPAPKVLDADGAEIRVGDKLYDAETGCGRTVRAINANGTIEFDGHGDRGWFANRFTHERPDSWERIEADAMMDAKEYCESRGISPEYPKHIGKAKCEDLVRRAKKLAEVE